jgi:hypothetical protein
MTSFVDLIGEKSGEWFGKWKTLHERLTTVTDSIEAALFGIGAVSVDNLTPHTGAQTFVLTSAKTLKAGMYRIESQANPTTKYWIVEAAADLVAGTSFVTNGLIAAGGAANDWVIYPLGGLLTALVPSTSQTSAYTTTKADHAATIQLSGTFDLSLGAIATLGIGHRGRLLNVGTGLVTVRRSSTDLIEGLTSILLRPGEAIEPEAIAAGAWRVVLARGWGAAVVGSDVTNYYLFR